MSARRNRRRRGNPAANTQAQAAPPQKRTSAVRASRGPLARWVETFATEKFRALPPDKFGEMLYSAIEQDAWLLYAHGGLLGILVGAVHILVFGA